ncbi:MAG: FAD-dependent oxidoreductase, partial [Myxococcaceae bacterium]|nr:FAD-dependent oxidoreductase [Myxococcaceae bacterium]
RGVESLAAGLGVERAVLADAVESGHVRDWTSDPFAGGGYCVIPAGAAEAPRLLARPVARTLFFAGEATHANGFSGTVHGALATGVRAALEVLTSTVAA